MAKRHSIVYVPFLYPIFYQWTLRLLPYLNNYNNAVMNIGKHISNQTVSCIPLDKRPKVEILDYTAVLFLIFWGTSILFFIVAAPICIPTNSVQGSPLIHIFANNCFFLVNLTGVSWCFILVLRWISLVVNDVKHHVLVCLLNVFFGKMSIHLMQLRNFSFTISWNKFSVSCSFSPPSGTLLMHILLYLMLS